MPWNNLASMYKQWKLQTIVMKWETYPSKWKGKMEVDDDTSSLS